jgi:hypothetical protein
VLNERIYEDVLTHVLADDNLSSDNVKLGIFFTYICGAKILDTNKNVLQNILNKLNALYRGTSITEVTKKMIEKLKIEKRKKFQSFPIISPNLKFLEFNHEKKHVLPLFDDLDPEKNLGKMKTYFAQISEVNFFLDHFQYDIEYVQNEKAYAELVDPIIKTYSAVQHIHHQPLNQQIQGRDKVVEELNLSEGGSSVEDKEN